MRLKVMNIDLTGQSTTSYATEMSKIIQIRSDFADI